MEYFFFYFIVLGGVFVDIIGFSSRVMKYVLLLFVDVVLFLVFVSIFGGITVPSFGVAFIIVLLLSFFNGLLWPILSYISLRFLVVTFGFGTFIFDGFILWILDMFMPGVSIGGMSLFTIPLLIAIINSFVSIVLDIHEDSLYYSSILKKELQNSRGIRDKDGFIFLEIDGLAKDILVEAIEKGDMPTLKSWIDEGSHILTSWETDLSSQTGASQAGILHGNNKDIPAFRWVEKENNNRIVSSNGFSDSTYIENHISNGRGLLSFNGASRSNLFSGDASDYILTFSKFASKRSLLTTTWYYLYSNPYFITRIIVLFMGDVCLELFSRIRQFVCSVYPRLRRNLSYFVARAGANVVMREATTISLIGDIFSGKYNVIYATYMGYDEIAHHSGIRDWDAFYALNHLDKQFRQLNRSIYESGNNYHLVVLSDHGQSGGPTFKQKFGYTLEDLVSRNLPSNITVHSILHSNDDHFYESLGLKKYRGNKDRIDDTIEGIKFCIRDIKEKNSFKTLKKRYSIIDSDMPVFDKLRTLTEEVSSDFKLYDDIITSNKTAQSIVLASGNLGLIYFTDWSVRLTYEQIEDAFPGLLSSLASHNGIGFIMVKSAVYGSIVLCDDSIYYLDEDKYEGRPFLDKFGDNVANHLRRTDSFEHVPDILVNSSYDEDTGEVYAFEELIGSHGGVGGLQQEPFILYPSCWKLNNKIVGAENLHKFFKNEMLKFWDDD